MPVVKPVLVGEELRLQDAEPREFCEQMSRSLTGGPHRVVGVQLLPGIEIAMSRREIEVVHARKTLLNRRSRSTACVRAAERWTQQCQQQ